MVDTADVNLLSYEQAKNAMIENLENYSYLSGELTGNYEKLELCYYCLASEGEENHVSIIPIWRLYHRKTNEFIEQGISFTAFDLITNAIDGSYIDTRSGDFPSIESQ